MFFFSWERERERGGASVANFNGVVVISLSRCYAKRYKWEW